MKRLLVLTLLMILPGLFLAQTTSAASVTAQEKPAQVKKPEMVKARVALKPFRVLTPDSVFDFKKLKTGQIWIKVEFNQDVDHKTVVAGSSVKVKMEKDPNAKGTIKWQAGSVAPIGKVRATKKRKPLRTFTWTSAKATPELCIYDSDCNFSLIITDKVKSSAGVKLDGDKNGTAGGKFKQNLLDMG